MHKVLVPLAITKLKENATAPVHFARETYIRKMVKYGILPIFVSGAMPREMVDELYQMTDGVLCMGGSDVDPARFGEAVHPKTQINEPTRDDLELYVIKKAMEDKKPFLGICRGIQMLAVANGGTLVQHVPDVAPDEHHTAEAYEDLEIAERRHMINVLPDTELHQILGKDTILANTAHHQSVKETGPNFKVSAVSPAGIIEAMESTDPEYFCVGVQSHPEAEEGELEPVLKAFAASLDRKS